MKMPLHQIPRFFGDYPAWLGLLLMAMPLGLMWTDIWPNFWAGESRAILAGLAGYLLALVGFTALGRRQSAWPALTQIGTAAAFGIAVGLLVGLYGPAPEPVRTEMICTPIASAKAHGAKVGQTQGVPKQFQCVAGKPDSGMESASLLVPGNQESETASRDPISSVETFAAVLGIALAVLTLVAQKSASEARMEAEKAQQLILNAWDIRLVSFTSRLALECQRLRENERLQAEYFESQTTLGNTELAACHQLWSSYWHHMASALVDLLHDRDDSRSRQARISANTLTRLANRINAQYGTLSMPAESQLALVLWREQHHSYIRPLQTLLGDAIKLLGDLGTGGQAARNHAELDTALRELKSALDILA